MLNTIQILSNHLNNETLIRLHHISPSPFLADAIKRRLGFTPLFIRHYLVGEHYIFKGSNFFLHFVDGHLFLYKNKYSSIHFEVIWHERVVLKALRVSFHHSSEIKAMMKELKTTFADFALDACSICHAHNLELRIHNQGLGADAVITLPYYIGSNLTQAIV